MIDCSTIVLAFYVNLKTCELLSHLTHAAAINKLTDNSQLLFCLAILPYLQEVGIFNRQCPKFLNYQNSDQIDMFYPNKCF